ncbi:MAG: SH3 domain-containing protein [Leptospiraceae bacterium]|nr:SH3 domain-containing protein [Leptospiraceae bacterium]
MVLSSFRSQLILGSLLGLMAACASQPVVVMQTTTATSAKVTPDTRYVDADGGLRMRSEPSLESQKLTTIPNGSPVTILSTSGSTITIAQRSGRWTQVTYNNQAGWVFGGFLSSTNPDVTKFWNLLPDYDTGVAWSANYWSTFCLGENAPKRCQLPIHITKTKSRTTNQNIVQIYFDAGHGYYAITVLDIKAEHGVFIVTGRANDYPQPSEFRFRFYGTASLELQIKDPNNLIEVAKINKTYRKKNS